VLLGRHSVAIPTPHRIGDVTTEAAEDRSDLLQVWPDRRFHFFLLPAS
jgi:hypothetical protein